MALTHYSFTAIIDSDSSGQNTVAAQAVEVNLTTGGYATIYSDSAGASPIAQPGAVTDSDGVFEFYIASGTYEVTSGGRTEIISVTNDADKLIPVTVAEMIARQGVTSGDRFIVSDRANAIFEAKTGLTANTYDIIQSTADVGIQLELDTSAGVARSLEFGMIGGSDSSGAFGAMMDSGLPMEIQKTASDYLLTSWTTKDTTSKLQIFGKGVINCNTTTQIFKILHDVDVRDVTFKNSGAVFFNTSADNASSNISKIKIKDCVFDTCTDPIAMECEFDDCQITDSHFKSCINNVLRLGENTYANQDRWKKMLIEKNLFTDITQSGTSETRAIFVYGKWANISNNLIFNVTGNASYETHGIYIKSRESNIQDNIIYNVNTGTTVSHISLKGHTRGATAQPQGYTNNVIGNTLICNGVSGGVRILTDDCLVSGNVIDDPVGAGIDETDGGLTHNRSSITDNKIYGTARASTSGISASINGDGCLIEQNDIYNFSPCVKIAGTGGSNITIKNNKLSGGAIAINAVSLTGVTIKDNETSGTTDYVIRFDGSPIDQVDISGNKLRGTATTAEISWDSAAAPTNLNLEHEFTINTTDATVITFFAPRLPDNTSLQA